MDLSQSVKTELEFIIAAGMQLKVKLKPALYGPAIPCMGLYVVPAQTQRRS